MTTSDGAPLDGPRDGLRDGLRDGPHDGRTPSRIVVIDDEQDMRASISQWLALSGFQPETYGSA
ncbi:hypothetical protein, partial [Pararhodobacter sp.]